MLCIHGGGWIEGDKREYRKSLFQFAEEKGVGAACINYRFVSGTVCYADLLNDITAALTAIQKKRFFTETWGIREKGVEKRAQMTSN